VARYHQVETAARIGMLTRERDIAAASAEALRLLSHLLPADAATLIAHDPFTGTHFKLAGVNCTERAARLLSVEFVNSPWYRDVLTDPLPVTASSDSGRSYRNGWFYREHVRPSGLNDAMGGALRCHGRYVGMVHLSTERAEAYTTDARQLLASLLPPLAALTDAVGRADQDVPGGGTACLVSGGRIIDLPGRGRPEMLGDDDFRRVLAEFAEAGGHRLRLLWPAGQGWHQVELSHRRMPGGLTAQAILVRAQPTSLPYGLSRRELDVLTRATMGQTDRCIAEALVLSPRTVHTHIQHVLRKTATASRAEAAALAIRAGLLIPVPGGVRNFIHSGG
jgi:DNA-binding CsgD family transcriptional regulator